MVVSRPQLVLFDLDHTLLDGDSDVLWCDYLIRHGVLNAGEFSARNADMDARYRAGAVSPREFCNFYVSTLAGRSAVDWAPVRDAWFAEDVRPRISQAARDLVQRHLRAGARVVMTTATNRFLVERTAAEFGITHLLATEPECVDDQFTGRTTGELNMREGKVARLAAWLLERNEPGRTTLANFDSTAYSDSTNDLPLLQAVDHPVAVNPDARLHAWATMHGHPVISLRTT
ncbi:MAG: HAD family hydrolase [Burkholderiales bacterium]|nr:HAD family hydrolase [Burkholderiales bacterium]